MINGQVKPSKQLTYGIILRSLTNSRKIINIINWYNQCTSYNIIKEVEIELNYLSTIVRQKYCFHQLHTNVAFDNFDKFMETSSGKDTFYDIVGIHRDEGTFQTISQYFPFIFSQQW